MSHVDQMAQAIARKMMSQEGTSPAWGLEYVDGGVGWATVRFKIKPDMINGYDMIHGGMIFALADSAFAYACNSRNQRAVAQQASINFLSSAVKGETLTATAREEALKGRSGVYTVTITADDGRTIAIFQGLSRTVRGQIIEEEE